MERDVAVCETRVLVVDDNEDIREIVKIVLASTGYECESAKDGMEALQRLRLSRFDAVITDVEMPELDGIALTKELSKSYSDLPVMIMTSHSDGDHEAVAFHAGAREFLSKPFAVPDLIAKLRRILSDR